MGWKKLSTEQKKVLSDFLNTIAAAWFTIGIISPVLSKPKSFLDVGESLVLGIVGTFFSLGLSIIMIRSKRQ